MSHLLELNENTTATQIAEVFSDRVKDCYIVITGVSKNGLGKLTARSLAAHDPALLVLVSRTQSKLEDVASEIKATYPGVNLKTVVLDLASQTSVRRAAEDIRSIVPRIDLLINNAGMTAPRRALSPEGIELQFASNHIGHFLLTNLLVDKLLLGSLTRGGAPARVVNLSSDGHRLSPIRFHDYNFEPGVEVPAEEQGPPIEGPFARHPSGQVVDGYIPSRAYGQAKTANILFSVALNKRLAKKGVVSFSIHPGSAVTEMGRDLGSGSALQKLFEENGFKLESLDQGAATTLFGALHPSLDDATHEVYLGDCQIAVAAPFATDEVIAERLWELSEELVGQKFL